MSIDNSINVGFSPLMLLLFTIIVLKTHQTKSTNPLILKEDSTHGLYGTDEEGRITNTRLIFSPENFRYEVKCAMLQEKMKMFFMILYAVPEEKIILYSSSNSEFPRSLKKGDYFLPSIKGEITFYSKTAEYPKDFKKCHDLNFMFGSDLDNIYNTISHSDFEFLKLVDEDLKNKKIIFNLFEYPFDDISPKGFKEMSIKFNQTLNDWYKKNYKNPTKNAFEIDQFVSPRESSLIKNAESIISNIQTFCDDFEEEESNSLFKSLIL